MRLFFNPSDQDYYAVYIVFGYFLVSEYFKYHFAGLNRNPSRIEAKLEGISDAEARIAHEVHEQYAIAMEQAETPSRLRGMKLGKTI